MSQRSIRNFGAIIVLIGVALIGFAWFGSRTTQQSQVVSDLTELASAQAAAIDPPAADADDDFPAIVDSAVKDPDGRSEPVGLTFEIIETIPHDTNAFTQGFEISDGRLFESTGLVDRSSIRELDIATGEIVRQTDVAAVFAEGLTVIDDTALQLTWKDGVAYRYDTETFDRTDTYSYEGEGWGLCDDGARLVMSNGSPTLQFRDRDSFALLSTVNVTFSGAQVENLNELECVGDMVWANIWQSSLIIEIDPSTGVVASVLNGRALTPPSVEGVSGAVLNGIAYDSSDDTFLLTGKLWPTIYRVRISDSAQ